jgi:hypothetical protein
MTTSPWVSISWIRPQYAAVRRAIELDIISM